MASYRRLWSETILDITDLVFIDPVGTSFSRAVGEHESKDFWVLFEDLFKAMRINPHLKVFIA